MSFSPFAGTIDEQSFREWDYGFDFYAPQTTELPVKETNLPDTQRTTQAVTQKVPQNDTQKQTERDTSSEQNDTPKESEKKAEEKKKTQDSQKKEEEKKIFQCMNSVELVRSSGFCLLHSKSKTGG